MRNRIIGSGAPDDSNACLIMPQSAITDGFVFDAQRQVKNARIALSKLKYDADRILGLGVKDGDVAQILAEARDCEMALAAVIDKLARAA